MLQSIARSDAPSLSKFLPPSNSLSHSCPATTDISLIRVSLLSALADLDIVPILLDQNNYLIRAYSASWSRSERRKRARGRAEPVDEAGTLRSPTVELEFYVRESIEGKVELEAVWKEGLSRVLFVGLWSHLIKKIFEVK